MNNEWFAINDFDEFVDAARILIFNSFGKNLETEDQLEVEKLLDCKKQDRTELDKSLSHDESSTIAKNVLRSKTNKITKKITYYVNDTKFMEFLELLNDRMVSNILNDLANMDLIESAFDNDSNDFIFWIKDEHKEEIKKIIEKPETD
jgi:Mg/Co/Ni transporter MgtE